jgi:hypothetical protein
MNDHFHAFLFETFGRRDGEFFAPFAIDLQVLQRLIVFLDLGDAVVLVHVFFNQFRVCLNKMNDLVFNGPFEKVQLPDGGFDTETLIPEWHFDAIPPTKGVKPAFGIGLEMEFVIVVDTEILTSICFVKGKILFGIVGGKPIHDTKRNPRLAIDNG